MNQLVFGDMQRSDWWTPDPLFKELDRLYGPFTLDAAASLDNAKCKQFITKEEDGLKQPWRGRVWCNPPYVGGEILKWVRKAYEEVQDGRCELACLLLPAHTSTDWFHDFALPFGHLHWIRRKVKFGGAKWTAIMPSLAVVFRAEDM